MSQRHYTGPIPKRSPQRFAGGVAWLLAALTIGLNIAYPLADVVDRPSLAIASVYAFFLASVIHATAHRGFAGLLLVGIVVPVIGWGAEAVGTRSGWPFGDYTYQDVLGPTLGSVPIVVPLAWAMMAYPAYVAAQRLSSHRVWIAVIGGWSLMAWDLFLDPMMVELGAWTWQGSEPSLPGIEEVPVQNFIAWFAVGVLVTAVLTFLPRAHASIAQPATLYLWVFASSVVGSAVYFERPEVAVIGGVAMGLVALPFAWQLWVNRR